MNAVIYDTGGVCWTPTIFVRLETDWRFWRIFDGTVRPASYRAVMDDFGTLVVIE